MSKDSDQTETAPREFKLGHLGNLNQVIKALGVTILTYLHTLPEERR